MSLAINVDKNLGNGDTLRVLFKKNGNGKEIITSASNKSLVNILDVENKEAYLNDHQGRSDYYKGIIQQFHKGNGQIEDIIEEVQ